MFYTVINGFSPNEVKIHLQICDDSMITFVIRGYCLGSLSSYYTDGLYRFRTTIVVKVKFDISILKKISIIKKKI